MPVTRAAIFGQHVKRSPDLAEEEGRADETSHHDRGRYTGHLYDATRYARKISKSKAKEAEVILATVQGLIVGAFVADDLWDAKG